MVRAMDTLAVVLEQPEHLVLSRLDLVPPGDDDVVVDIEWSGISTGTERLLWSGRMPPFPGMGYVDTRGEGGFQYVPMSYQMMMTG